MTPTAEELTVFLEVDRRGGLLNELADTDERKTQFTVREESASQVTETLRRTVEKHS